MDSPFFDGIRAVTKALQNREISAVELSEAFCQRITTLDSAFGSYVTVTPDVAKMQAQAADAKIKSGSSGPLTGVPMQLKDNLSTKWVETTCGSHMLKGYLPPYDATVAWKLSSSGSVLLGKGNMDEYAMGSSTETSAFGPTKNPWDTDRVPGGSSGGPAAAVAAGLASFSLGSDTGGSIRQPAAFCGVVGLKPTYGLVSRYGLIAFASSLDQIGPITRNVEDAALVLTAIAGPDSKDSTSIPTTSLNYLEKLNDGVTGIKIGVVSDYFGEGIDPKVATLTRAAISVLEGLGAQVDWQVSLPTSRAALAVYYVIAPSECSANLARYDGVTFGYADAEEESLLAGLEATRNSGFGDEVKRRIMMGTYALSAGYYDAYYKKAQQVRTLIRQEFARAFSQYDVLVTPTAPTTAFKLGEVVDPVVMHANDICTVPANIAGIPGISIPCGYIDGLPAGLQILGPHLGEPTVLQVAHAYEQATTWHKSHPTL